MATRRPPVSIPDDPSNTLEKIITTLNVDSNIRAWLGSALQGSLLGEAVDSMPEPKDGLFVAPTLGVDFVEPYLITTSTNDTSTGDERRQFVMEFDDCIVTFTANMTLGPDGDIVVSHPTDWRRIHKTPGKP